MGYFERLMVWNKISNFMIGIDSNSIVLMPVLYFGKIEIR